MNMHPSPILLEGLRASGVAGGKVTVVLVAKEAWGIQEVSLSSFLSEARYPAVPSLMR